MAALCWRTSAASRRGASSAAAPRTSCGWWAGSSALRRPRHQATLLALLLPLLFGGCESILRELIDVPEPDVFLFPDGLRRDGGPDGDLTTGERLTLLDVAPDHGSFAGGTRAVINGSGFGEGLAVFIGGKQVPEGDVILLSPLALELITPPGEVGPQPLEVRREDASALLVDAFTYDPINLDPPDGPTAGGTLITLQTKDLELTSETSLTLGGAPATAIDLISANTLQARTPPGAPGPAALVVGTPGGEVRVEEAFEYYDSANPHAGGLGGGPIQGTVTVTALNWLTRAPIAGAKVVLQQGRELELLALTDAKGVALFTDDGLAGPVTVTAGAPQHESATIVGFDARDVTLFLYPLIPPQPGGLPPGQQTPRVRGYVLFGGTTGAGTAEWKIVAPPQQGQVKRAYVFASNTTVRSHGPPSPTTNATIDFDPGAGLTAWPYTLYVRPGNVAIYAVAGLYHTQTGVFEPYALGIVRGVVTAPGDDLQVDVVVNIPLTEQREVRLVEPPPQGNRHRVRLAIHLGADGFILRQDHQLSGVGVPESITFGRLPAFHHPELVDAYYAVDVVLDSTAPSALPLIRATERLVKPDVNPIEIGGFIGVPKQLKPASGGPLQGNTLRWTYDGPTPDLVVTTLQRTDETPVWQLVSPGNVTEIQLPDPPTFGLPHWPPGPIVWLHWLARLDGWDYNTFTYRHLSSAYWLRWSFDQFTFEVPAP